MEARSNAIKEGKPLNGNDIKTACQVACPTNAISFGDANDINSEVAKLRKHDLSYHVLEELNVKPNVTYIAKLRNIHSEDVI
jgi:molybdopterin-containing oxidoreductase family iron-sulfur binding subunit